MKLGDLAGALLSRMPSGRGWGVEKPGAITFGFWVGQDSSETEKMEGLMSWLKSKSFNESRNLRHHLHFIEYILYTV